MREPYGHTLFCDDIRVEASQKHTYIGIYKSDIVVLGAFPATLLKLCMVVTYSQSVDDPVLPTALKVFFPGDPLDTPRIEGVVPMSAEVAERFRNEPESEDSPRVGRELTFALHVSLENVPIPAPGRIKVRAYRGDEEIRCGTINVRPATPEEAAQYGVQVPQA